MFQRQTKLDFKKDINFARFFQAFEPTTIGTTFEASRIRTDSRQLP